MKTVNTKQSNTNTHNEKKKLISDNRTQTHTMKQLTPNNQTQKHTYHHNNTYHIVITLVEFVDGWHASQHALNTHSI